MLKRLDGVHFKITCGWGRHILFLNNNHVMELYREFGAFLSGILISENAEQLSRICETEGTS
jgi:hypothetical protein